MPSVLLDWFKGGYVREIRVHHNPDQGARWWAEDDFGFTGGAETLDELVVIIEEWASLEGVAKDEYKVLVDSDPETSSQHLAESRSP